MHLTEDVSHNIAKIERHEVGGVVKALLVHCKGPTNPFPPYDQCFQQTINSQANLY